MDYRKKVITIDEALNLVKSDMEIFTGLGGGEAQEFFTNLHTIGDRVKNVRITNCLPTVNGQYLNEEYKDSFSVDSLFYAGQLRKAHKNGNISYIPNHLHLSGLNRLSSVKPDIFVGIGSRPDKHGYISLSLSNTYEKRAIKEADLVIIEINENYPRTFGDLEIHIDQVDYLVESKLAVPVIPEGKPSEKDLQIGRNIAEYINDGDCIQLGIGGIPDAVAMSLKDKKDLGVHTEMMTTGMMKLAKAGVINGRRKNNFNGKIVCTFALGTEELYEYLDDNPSVVFMDAHFVNNPDIIKENDNMVSINTTLEVDLTGQCASESIGSKQFSGTGGQADTAVGAQKSKNGRSFIALYSTAMVRVDGSDERQEISTIVPMLKPGAVVSLSRNDVDYIVTEYGVAHLKGRSISERVKRLVEIAHPKFREELLEDARKVGLID